MFFHFPKSFLLTIVLLVGASAEAATFEYRIVRAKQATSTPLSPLPGPGGGDSSTPGGPAAPLIPGNDSQTGGNPAGSPVLELSAASVNFGRTPTNSYPVTRQIQIINSGSAPLVFNSPPYLTGSTALDLGLSSCGTSLAPGSSCSIEVVYYPTAVGVDNAGLYLKTNVQALEVPVQGEAFNPVQLSKADFTLVNNQWYKISFLNYLTIENEPTDPWLVTWEVLDPVPVGMSFFTGSGILSGTPSESPINGYVVRVRATYRGNTTTQAFRIEVGDCDQFNLCYTTQPDPPGSSPSPGGPATGQPRD